MFYKITTTHQNLLLSIQMPTLLKPQLKLVYLKPPNLNLWIEWDQNLLKNHNFNKNRKNSTFLKEWSKRQWEKKNKWKELSSLPIWKWETSPSCAIIISPCAIVIGSCTIITGWRVRIILLYWVITIIILKISSHF